MDRLDETPSAAALATDRHSPNEQQRSPDRHQADRLRLRHFRRAPHNHRSARHCHRAEVHAVVVAFESRADRSRVVHQHPVEHDAIRDHTYVGVRLPCVLPVVRISVVLAVVVHCPVDRPHRSRRRRQHRQNVRRAEPPQQGSLQIERNAVVRIARRPPEAEVVVRRIQVDPDRSRRPRLGPERHVFAVAGAAELIRRLDHERRRRGELIGANRGRVGCGPYAVRQPVEVHRRRPAHEGRLRPRRRNVGADRRCPRTERRHAQNQDGAKLWNSPHLGTTNLHPEARS